MSVCPDISNNVSPALVVGIEVKKVPEETKSWVQSFGIIDGGLELMKEAWPSLEHKFSVRRSAIELAGDAGTNKPTIYLGHHRYPAILLKKHPVDLLAVENGYLKTPPIKYSRTAWTNLVEGTPQECRPRVVVETWPASAQMWRQGPICKAHTTVWKEMGYTTRCRVVNATEVGGAVNQERLIVARVHVHWDHLWRWGRFEAGLEVT